MFVREHQNQFRGAQADVKTFYGNYNSTSTFGWNKPVGTTFVYIMLIGAGGAGDAATAGGGSGAISVWFGAARNIPNALTITLTTANTRISSRVGGTTTNIFDADAGTSTAGGVADVVDGYYASGFYSFTAGLNGNGGPPGASTTTFLQGGAGQTTASTGNYGYIRSSSREGYFFLSPVPVGMAGGNPNNSAQSGAYGCGAFYTNTTSGGPGMAVIASW